MNFRFILIALLLLNVLAVAAVFGWLGDTTPPGEPERITNQILAQNITVLSNEEIQAKIDDAPSTKQQAAATPPASPAEAALPPMPEKQPLPTTAATPPAAPPAPELTPPTHDAASQTCLRYNSIPAEDLAEIQRLGSKTKFTGLALSERLDPSSQRWLVLIPPGQSLDDAISRAKELKALGLKEQELYIIRKAGRWQHAIQLGSFKTESSAEKHLADMSARGVIDATKQVGGNLRYQLVIRGNSDQLTTLQRQVAKRWPKFSPKSCT